MERKNFLQDFPKDISIGFYEGFCNLQCPKCQVYGKDKKTNNLIKGTMSLEKACKLFDELKDSGAVLAGGGYGEPLLQKNIWEYLKAMKARGIEVNINTNGLLMTEEYAKRLVGLEIDCVFVSIDATTKDTLKKVRGTDELEKINEAVFAILKVRGNKLYPRIGVSFVVEENNIHEKEEFLAFWIQHVDVIRIAELFPKGNNIEHTLIPKDRKPCPMLYKTMLIHHNGDVPICCWDGYGKTKVGNVFEEGIKSVWLGKEFQKIRYYHETGQFDKVPFCKECKDWPRYMYTREEIVDNILMRRSPLLVYYNRTDRLVTWKFGMGKLIKVGCE